MNIHFFIIIFLLYTVSYCGNPQVHYSIIKYKKSTAPGKGSPVLTREKGSKFYSKHGRTVESAIPGNWISVDMSDEYALWFGFLDKKIFNHLSDKANIQINKNFRLPRLQYFTFQFKYYGKRNMEVDFFRAYFVDGSGRKYHAIHEKEFKKKFTSVAYSWLDHGVFFIPYRKVSENSDDEYLPIEQANASQKMQGNHGLTT